MIVLIIIRGSSFFINLKFPRSTTATSSLVTTIRSILLMLKLRIILLLINIEIVRGCDIRQLRVLWVFNVGTVIIGIVVAPVPWVTQIWVIEQAIHVNFFTNAHVFISVCSLTSATATTPSLTVYLDPRCMCSSHGLIVLRRVLTCSLYIYHNFQGLLLLL